MKVLHTPVAILDTDGGWIWSFRADQLSLMHCKEGCISGRPLGTEDSIDRGTDRRFYSHKWIPRRYCVASRMPGSKISLWNCRKFTKERVSYERLLFKLV